MSLNLATMLRASARAHPGKPVALYDGRRLSDAELDALSDRSAAALRTSGVGPGASVGIRQDGGSAHGTRLVIRPIEPGDRAALVLADSRPGRTRG
jgi:non-ribosomal peptide synthetase component E (peptide arylation enzyme)